MKKQYNSIKRPIRRSLPKNTLTGGTDGAKVGPKAVLTGRTTGKTIEIPSTAPSVRTVHDIRGNLLNYYECQLEQPPIQHLSIKLYRTSSMGVEGSKEDENGGKADEISGKEDENGGKQREITNNQIENNPNLMLNITPDKSFFYITDGTKVVDGAVVPRTIVRQMFYSRNEFLLELNDKGGYCWIAHLGYDQVFDLFMKTTVVTVGHKNIRRERERIESEMTGGRFQAIDPATAYGSVTRTLPRPRRTRLSPSEALSEVETLETPAPFLPDLKYKFNDGKSFVVGHSDFKTLYNNDWVNDSIIDFFINYEIDEVVAKNMMKRSEIYAFNSFFFSKLVSNPNNLPKDSIDYYQNVARWVSKLDLFSYDNVIVPINENLHWYGCIIIGLSEYLAKKALEVQVLSNGPGKEEALIKYNNLSINEKLRFKDRVNIFVFDSLSQKHSGIHLAFKTFLIEYCKDKYGYDMLPTDIVFRACKVPKQNNFNDCGIHVIYNIRKFLNERNKCLEIWDNLSNEYKTFFKASERSGMRKELIDFLLELHGKMMRKEGREGKEGEGEGEKIGESEKELEKELTETPEKQEEEGKEEKEEDGDDDIEIIDTVQLDNVKVQKKNLGRRKELYVTVGNGINRRVEGEGESEGSETSVNVNETTIGEKSSSTNGTKPQSTTSPDKISTITTEVPGTAKRRRIEVLPEFKINAAASNSPTAVPNAAATIRKFFGLEEGDETKLKVSSGVTSASSQAQIMDLVSKFKPNYHYVLQNLSLHTARILKDITNFTTYLLNHLIPTEEKFNENQISQIYMFKKRINHLRPRYAKEISEAYCQLQHEMAESGRERPRNELFRIEPNRELIGRDKL